MRLAVWAAIAVVCGANAGAQTLATQGPPAEMPPASYTAPQYVDSRGCVYVRAGLGDLVNWVPRVNRERRHLCGFEPSLTTPPEPQPTPATAPVITIPAQPDPTPVAAPAPIAKPAAPVAQAPIRTATRPAPVPRSPRVISAPVLTKKQVCEGAHGVIPGYVIASTRAPVDCGPAPVVLSAAEKAQLCLIALENGQSQIVTEAGASLTCAPRAVVKKGRSVWPAPPRGYERVFTDGRLNPNRGIIRIARSEG